MVSSESRTPVVRRSAGSVSLAISRFTDTRRPTARRPKTPTAASTTMTSEKPRKILDASRMPSACPQGP